MKKIVSIPLVVLALVISLASMSFRKADGEIKITATELNNMPFERFIVANSDISIESCVVTVEVGSEVKNYTITRYALPDELKSYFSTVKPGAKILLQKRVGYGVDGKKKLPSVTYLVVESH